MLSLNIFSWKILVLVKINYDLQVWRRHTMVHITNYLEIINNTHFIDTNNTIIYKNQKTQINLGLFGKRVKVFQVRCKCKYNSTQNIGTQNIGTAFVPHMYLTCITFFLHHNILILYFSAPFDIFFHIRGHNSLCPTVEEHTHVSWLVLADWLRCRSWVPCSMWPYVRSGCHVKVDRDNLKIIGQKKDLV